MTIFEAAKNSPAKRNIPLRPNFAEGVSRYNDGTKAPEIGLEKSISNGTVYVSECVPDSSNKVIWITSAYINKNGSKGQLLNMEESSPPQPTSEASFDGNATTTSIPNSTQKVNSSSEGNSSKVNKYDLTSLNQKKLQFTGDNDEETPVERNTDVDTDTRFALPYDDAIDKLAEGTLDTTQNTHLKVLEHTPQIYIDKAGASDREIVMSWDIAYLAMNKNGTLSGNYHGLGAEIMKALPAALEDPLYIVKQKNGRIAAVTKNVVKGKRAVFASIELEAYQTTIQEGVTEAKKYNLVLTVTDAKQNYLQNTIFSGEIVHNKNSEDPAHFILRLKSLKKAVPTYDLAGSSNNIIRDIAEKTTPLTKFLLKILPTAQRERLKILIYL